MKKHTLSINLLTPVWTGNADMVPNGLKDSGVIGSMRMIFESLIRRSGGHTCNINDDKARCNFEKDKHICPACAVFGCTGLSRAFKINWNLEAFNRVGSISLPEIDHIERFRNRTHDEQPYPGYTSIDTWLATAVSPGRGTIPPNDHTKARAELGKMHPAYLADPKTRQRISSAFEIIPLRKLQAENVDLLKLIAGLVTWMSDYYAIGAKVNQGWGFFEVPEGGASEGELNEELGKLIEACPFHHPDWDKDLLNAEWIPYLEPIEVKYQKKGPKDSLNFFWNSSSHPELFDFIPLGFALQYRLRRLVKFWTMDYEDDDPECYYNLLAEDGLIDDWAKKTENRSRIDNYKREHHVTWKKEGAFAEYLFGLSDPKEKSAGKIGVSHLYKKDGKWYVRMISTLPDYEYVAELYEILKDQAERSC